MTVIDKSKMVSLRVQIDEALKAVGAANDVSLKLANGKFSGDSTGNFKLEIVALGDDGVKTDVSAADYKRYAMLFDLKPEWFGQQFMSNGSMFRISGLKPSRHKYPVSGIRSDGRSFKFGADTVKRGMEISERRTAAQA
jgi:hypothetical protein